MGKFLGIMCVSLAARIMSLYYGGYYITYPHVSLLARTSPVKKNQDGGPFIVFESANIATSHGEFIKNG